MHVLIVDNDTRTCETLSASMQSARGWNVTTAASGATGLRRVNTQRFDAIIVDICLPDMAGLDLLTEIQQSLSAEASIFVVTRFLAPGDAEQAIRCGACAYLEKPLEIDELLRAIDSHQKRPTDSRLELVLSTVELNVVVEVATLAQLAELSESRLRHLFKARYHIPLTKFLRNRRLDRVAQILETSGRNIEGIAAELRVGDVRTLYRSFRKRFGASPSVYRRRHLSLGQPKLSIAKAPHEH